MLKVRHGSAGPFFIKEVLSVFSIACAWILFTSSAFVLHYGI